MRRQLTRNYRPSRYAGALIAERRAEPGIELRFEAPSAISYDVENAQKRVVATGPSSNVN